MAHMFIKELKVGEKLVDYYLVRSKRQKTSKVNKAFLDIDLADKSGQINAKVFDNAEELGSLFSRGDVIKVEAVVSEFNGAKQLKIGRLRAAEEGDGFDWNDLIKRSPFDPEKLMEYIRARADEIEDGHLAALMKTLLDDGSFVTEFCRAPAARNIHHAYEGGLIEHTSKVMKTAVFAADVLYAGEVDRDLLIAGSFLHDIGKMRELEGGAEVGYSRDGYLLGHITIGVQMLGEILASLPDFPADLRVELEHIVISHHGEKEWGSPVTPMTPEAMIVHIADNLDAKTQIALSAIEEDPNEDEEFTQYNRTMARHFFKSPRKKSEE